MRFFHTKILIFCVLALAGTLHGRSAEIKLEQAGTLCDVLGENPATTSLTISGEMNVRDFDYLRNELNGVLAQLDLSKAKIVAYQGDATFTGRTESPADVLPEGALMIPSLKSVTLPPTLVEIADGALATTSISSITLPSTLKAIGRSAFAGCLNLESVLLPASVSELGNGAFADCTGLTTADLSKATALTRLGDAAFARCSNLSEVVLPPALTEIGGDAFAACTSLETTMLPTSLIEIGPRAFYGSALTAADMSRCKGLATIGEWAFANCGQLALATMPESITELGTGAFYKATALTIDELPNLPRISDLAFTGINGLSTSELTLAEGMEIGNFALSGWKSVETLTLPGSLERIGDEAMAGWTSLMQIDATESWEVPLLGADVWAGVDQPSVLLRVPEVLADDYKSADQWKEFNIESVSAGVENLPADEAAEVGIKAWMEGLTLHVEAPAEIAAIEIFDIDGRRFSFPMSLTTSTRASVDTSAWNARVMLVRVSLADGTSAAMKLAR